MEEGVGWLGLKLLVVVVVLHDSMMGLLLALYPMQRWPPYGFHIPQHEKDHIGSNHYSLMPIMSIAAIIIMIRMMKAITTRNRVHTRNEFTSGSPQT